MNKNKIIHKSFKHKKQLIKYLLDADSNAQDYILQIQPKIALQKPQKQPEQKKSKSIQGLWYGHIAKEIELIQQPISTLKINIWANWWFTQIDSDSRAEVGEEARVNQKWYQVSQLAQAIYNSEYLSALENLYLSIIHPLLTKHFKQLVQVLNDLPKLKKIEIDFPSDTGTYYIQKGNWTQQLNIKPIIKFTQKYITDQPYQSLEDCYPEQFEP